MAPLISNTTWIADDLKRLALDLLMRYHNHNLSVFNVFALGRIDRDHDHLFQGFYNC